MTEANHKNCRKLSQKQNGRLPSGQRLKNGGGVLCLGLDLHGWMCLVTYWLIFFVRPIGYSTMGIFIVEFIEYFRGATQAQIAWLAACHLGATPLVCSMPIGCLTERFGSRIVVCMTSLIGTSGLILSAVINNLPSLYIGYGVMLGCCVISYQIIGSILVQTTLPVRRNMFAGISFTFLSAGAFVWPAVSRFLIDAFCWQGALLILAGINLNVAALSQIVPNTSSSRPPLDEGYEGERVLTVVPEQNGHSYNDCTPCVTQIETTQAQADTALIKTESTQIHTKIAQIDTGTTQIKREISQIQRETTHKSAEPHIETVPEVLLDTGGYESGRCALSVCGRPSYTLLLVYCLGYFFNQITLYSIFLYFPIRCKEEGYTKREAVLLVSLISISGCIFRTPAGALGDVKCINPCFVTTAANFVTGVTCVLSTYCQSLVGLGVCSCIMGSALAFFVALINACTEYVVGKSRLGMGFAILNTAQGLAMILGFPLSGFFLDHLGNSHTLFLYIGVSALSGGILVFLAGILRRSPCMCERSSK